MRSELRNAVANRIPLGCGDYIGTAKANDVGAAETGDRFAKRAAWKNVVEAERFERIEQNDVETAKQPPMLESIVQDNEFTIKLVRRFIGRGDTVRVLHVWYVRERPA